MEKIDEKQPPDVIASDTENRTRIDPSEAPPGLRAKYERFRAYNTGMWNGPKRENKEAMFRQDNLHRFDAISSRLDLASHQKERGRKMVDVVSISELTGIAITADMILWAICVIVANEDVDDGYRYWPHADSKENDLLFDDVAAELGMDHSAMQSVFHLVRERVKE